MWFLNSFVKSGEIRPSLSYKIIPEQREEIIQLNKPFPTCCEPRYEFEARCTAFRVKISLFA